MFTSNPIRAHRLSLTRPSLSSFPPLNNRIIREEEDQTGYFLLSQLGDSFLDVYMTSRHHQLSKLPKPDFIIGTGISISMIARSFSLLTCTSRQVHFKLPSPASILHNVRPCRYSTMTQQPSQACAPLFPSVVPPPFVSYTVESATEVIGQWCGWGTPMLMC